MRLSNLRPILRSETGSKSPVFIAWRGEIDRSFSWLDRIAVEGQSYFGLKTEPFLKTLHDDPRWEPLLQKLGLADAQLLGVDI